MRIDFEAIHSRFSLLEYCRQRGIVLHRSGQNWVGRCPLHQERKGQSFVVFKDHWTCFGKCSRRGDIVDLEQALGGGTVQEAVHRLLGTAPDLPKIRQSAPVSRSDSKVHWNWPKLLRLGTSEELFQLASERLISLQACQLAQERDLLRFITHHEGTAWVVSDRLRQNGIARLLYARLWGNGAKAKMLPGSCGKRPIGTIDAMDFPNVVIVEGGPDLLAAFHFMLKFGVEQQVAPICMASASAEFLRSELERLRGKTIRLFPHADEKGSQAGERWLKQTQKVSAAVAVFDFRQLNRLNGTPVKDLNDLTSEPGHFDFL
jgi:CHC2 zinc finger